MLHGSEIFNENESAIGKHVYWVTLLRWPDRTFQGSYILQLNILNNSFNKLCCISVHSYATEGCRLQQVSDNQLRFSFCLPIKLTILYVTCVDFQQRHMHAILTVLLRVIEIRGQNTRQNSEIFSSTLVVQLIKSDFIHSAAIALMSDPSNYHRQWISHLERSFARAKTYQRIHLAALRPR